MILRTIDAASIPEVRAEPLDAATLSEAAHIVDDVRARGWDAVVEHAVRLGDAADGEPLVHHKDDLERAFTAVPEGDRALLQRTADRIRAFALSQRRAL